MAAILLVPGFVLAVEACLALYSFTDNGGSAVARDSATAGPCHRDMVTGWAQYACGLRKDGKPYEPGIPMNRPTLKSWKPVHGSVEFEIRESHGKGGTRYQIVKEGTARPLILGLILMPFLFFGVIVLVYKLLRALLRRSANLVRPSADLLATRNPATRQRPQGVDGLDR
ncbi:hypothetical protein [Actinomadura montaniterrae]|uniref:Uncharacterized protein n=1 Tax=Actinomadura montaniterrae TaxID=1803903 RepID=A0A6L3VJN4_9ACTN|nr:hypothetical protein [Actinomadura montaniterrae]KAB2364192.1 hypothetical protein F9B16_42040 [Actinomadura montaniterrae]